MNENGQPEIEKIQCEHCEYVWWTRSKDVRPTCPNCKNKTERINAC